MKNAVIMQARVGSSRLHAKVLKELCGKTVLEHDVARIRQAERVQDIIIATTTNPEDEAIAAVARRCQTRVFKGSEQDVLDRYYQAAKAFEVDHIIRITSDCPLIDPFVIDEVIRCYEQGHYDIITNVPNEWEKMSYPRGLDLEIFSFAWLERAWLEAKDAYDREHVSPYIYDHAQTRYYYRCDKDYSMYRWTLDTEADWQVIRHIYEHFYHGKHDFYFEDIVAYMEAHPEIAAVNADVVQKLRGNEEEHDIHKD